jgi:4-amino-4-deoxy-L-arabinose transferase-like glycosyltransferase
MQELAEKLGAELDLQKSDKRFMVCIVTVCLVFLLIGMNGDSPICTENDELCYGPVSLFMITHNTLDPGWFTNPASTTIYSLWAYYKIVQAFTGQAIVDPHYSPFQMVFRNMDVLLKWPRLSSVAFVLLSLPLLYVIGRRWLGRVPAMLGVTFYALSPLVIYYGQILRPDMLANLLIVLSIFLFDQIIERPASRPLAIAIGIVVGLAVSTRFFCLALTVPLATIYGVRLVRAALKPDKLAIIKAGLLSALVSFGTFVFTSPFVLIDFHQLMDDLKFEAQSNFCELTGLGPFGNLQYYMVEGIPEAIGKYLTAIAAVALVAVVFRRRTLKTCIYVLLLSVFVAGTCMNPRHWARWVLPMLPILSLLAGYGLNCIYDAVNCLLSKRTSVTAARTGALIAVTILGASAFFFPIRRLISDEWQKSRLSERAMVFPYIKKNIPHGTKIALDSSWDWPDYDLYQVTPDIWRPDFVPPRPHNYRTPEDLARAGFEYMIVQRWNREYYAMEEQKEKYPQEYAFFHALMERAPLLFDTGVSNHPTIMGREVGWRVSPVEVYDLRPLAKTDQLRK